MLQIIDLVKIYDGGVLALDKVSFDVHGPVCCRNRLERFGKSTLLRCINRLIEPTAVKSSWNGEDVTCQ